MSENPNSGQVADLPVSSEQLFRDALAPTPEQPAATPAEPAPEAKPGEPLRDERGRYASATPPAPQPTPQPEPQPQPTEEANVPSGRFRELREERDALAARNRHMEMLFFDQQRQLNEMRARMEPPKAPEVPDPVVDHQAYTRHLQNGFSEQLRNMEANFSFRMAHREHGETFENAYGEMIMRAERGDPSVVRAVMASPDPGAAMVNWFRREQTLRLVGDDPNAWFEHQLSERMKDQKFAGSMLERIRGGAAPANGNPQGGPVVLPPSLNRTAASAPAADQLGDGSNDSVWAHVRPPGR